MNYTNKHAFMNTYVANRDGEIQGPGKVTLQSMPIAAIAMQLAPYMPKSSS